jgi:hypothetical protein
MLLGLEFNGVSEFSGSGLRVMRNERVLHTAQTKKFRALFFIRYIPLPSRQSQAFSISERHFLCARSFEWKRKHLVLRFPCS